MKNESKKTRTECDLLGCVEVPDNVLYGVQTMRGLENFAISKFRLCEYPRTFRSHIAGLPRNHGGQVP